ncbi:MAG: PTS lactose/cellobiose transporter subunit IIA [Mycoplasmoidaceae bacterium]
MEKKFTFNELAERSFQIITYAGMAKSDAMEAIYAAKKDDFETAKTKLESSHKNMIEAEKFHADLVQHEARVEEAINAPLLLIHAEDQLLSTQTLILMAEEIIDLHKKIASK